jgi:hypothetical protein
LPTTKKTVSSATTAPRPPVDLWERLDAFNSINRVAERPAGSFSVVEYAKRYGLTIPSAQRLVKMMYDEDKLKRVKVGAHFYYLLSDVTDHPKTKK